jgi:hypothetical protein
MKIRNFIIVCLFLAISIPSALAIIYYSKTGFSKAIFSKIPIKTTTPPKAVPLPKPKVCVFKTIMGEENSDSFFIYKTPESATSAMTNGLAWMVKAQNNDGGWGAGSHYSQDIRDPHAVSSDPATTAMVCMALLRCDNQYKAGKHATQLQKGTEFLIAQVNATPDNQMNITTLTGTQPQIKLGANIDVVLTSQYLTNLLDHIQGDAQLNQRVKTSIDKCVKKIQNNQDVAGKTNGGGWAGVLQSSFATNAVETAKAKGISVDDVKLDKARDYQKQNMDASTGTSKTEDAAGVVLYSVSSSVRSSAKETKEVNQAMAKAINEGKISKDAEVNNKTLQQLGYSDSESEKYVAAYKINEAAKNQVMREDVMNGFGNNGGEEYLSHLQTGESFVMGRDNGWKKWYDNVSGKLISAQTQDGSWQGHHCITSPVFCTATCLLILSIQNDLDKLAKL